jgi:hypothetical protein
MGEIVNLRKARKRKAAAQAEVAAAANRAAFGVSKKERAKAEAERILAQARLDGHLRLDRDGAE